MKTNRKFYSLNLETYAIEIVFGAVRFIPLFVLLVVIFWAVEVSFGPVNMYGVPQVDMEGITSGAFLWGGLIAYSNVIASIAAHMGFGSGGYWTRIVLGARNPSTRELEELNQFLRQVAEAAQKKNITVKTFSKFYVLDSPLIYANVIGSTLYISSGTFGSRSFQALVVHELAHLHQADGRQILALRRLVSPVFQMLVGDVRNFSTNPKAPRPEMREFEAMAMYFAIMNKVVFFILSLFGGGTGVYVLSWPWAEYFRWRDYLADAFVAKLGYKDVLIEYLEESKFYDTAVPYMLSWKPANELRIDALLHPDVYNIPEVGGQVGTGSRSPKPTPPPSSERTDKEDVIEGEFIELSISPPNTKAE